LVLETAQQAATTGYLEEVRRLVERFDAQMRIADDDHWHRHTPIQIEVSAQGKFFALRAEKHLLAVITDRKAAETIEAVIRGMIYYSSRNAFRIALNPKPKAEKPKKGGKTIATAPATEPPAPPVNGANPSLFATEVAWPLNRLHDMRHVVIAARRKPVHPTAS